MDYLDSLHNVAQLEVKKLINLMGADGFGKFAILVLKNWNRDELTLDYMTEVVQKYPKYFMFGAKSYFDGLTDEEMKSMYNIKYDDIWERKKE